MSQQDALSITTVAAARLRSFLEDEEGNARAMRIAVEPGGCAGLLYEVTFDVVPTESDVVVKSQGVQVVLSQDSARYINGAVIDFAANSLIVRNPNAATSCSCGASFATGADDCAEDTTAK